MEIIEILNDRFGTEFKKADQLAIDSVAEELGSEVEGRAKSAPFEANGYTQVTRATAAAAMVMCHAR